jgi:hypothetical protein
MKQQEILRKIGNILKELNEQYDYLQTEETHLNDLELELFAANAKFLTDHTEILRKINAQSQNIRLTLPEHTETEANPTQASNPQHQQIELPAASFNEAALPPFAESAIAYEPHTEPVQEPELQPETNQEDLHTYFQKIADKKGEPIRVEEIQNGDETVKITCYESVDDNGEKMVIEDYRVIKAEEDPFPSNIHEEQEYSLSIDTDTDHNSNSFVRQDPQVSNDEHTFSISSSREEEPVPPHVDLEAEMENFKEEPTQFTSGIQEPAQAEHTEPVHSQNAGTLFTDNTYEHTPPEQAQISALTEPEPVAVPAVEETQAYTPEPVVEQPTITEQPAPVYTPPVTEEPKPEAQHPLTLNERLSAQLQSKTTAYTQQPQAITDIKSAISLNDKMLYVKDLFNGYSLAYSEAIELLNRCKSFDEADRFLKSNYVTKNNWTDKPETVDKFYAVLHRRFTA